MKFIVTDSEEGEETIVEEFDTAIAATSILYHQYAVLSDQGIEPDWVTSTEEDFVEMSYICPKHGVPAKLRIQRVLEGTESATIALLKDPPAEPKGQTECQ